MKKTVAEKEKEIDEMKNKIIRDYLHVPKNKTLEEKLNIIFSAHYQSGVINTYRARELADI